MCSKGIAVAATGKGLVNMQVGKMAKRENMKHGKGRKEKQKAPKVG